MLLEVRGLAAAYGASQVLFGLSIDVGAGEVISLIGRNGMGKSTTVKSIVGMLKPKAGTVRFNGERIDGQPSHRLARMGLGLVPEGRRIFPNLTVRENLVMAAADRRAADDPWTLERVIAFFPRLGERLGNGGHQLSGGEQQMLAIGRALMTNPVLLILDEATEGLAPVIRELIWTRLAALKATGLAMIVIDKDIEAVAALADRHFVVEKGEILWTGSSGELMADTAMRALYLAV
ncbi:ABC transporter ATP-binding protein [Phreatobacter stygius]|uniref:ABC transporter ATP-binding protein n=1 Tax=Phreatobacter stygius TaxID=1940610 RepID=A0A4D7AZG1_9HYPH|nr:ABC transporter ATP-binding protein [Phreatobacter stygius]QCI64745.1 ABC transporter ATP-binding protein [Phreatobacter stygius]